MGDIGINSETVTVCTMEWRERAFTTKVVRLSPGKQEIKQKLPTVPIHIYSIKGNHMKDQAKGIPTMVPTRFHVITY